MLPELAVSVILGSYHFDRTQEYNEINPGVIVSAGPLFAGVYRNSYSRTAVVAGVHVPLFELGPVKVGVMAGLATGYKNPVIGGLSFTVGRVTAKVMPPVGGASGVIGFSYRIK